MAKTGELVSGREKSDDGVWGKYWIRAGLEVVHRDHVTDLNRDRLQLYKMVVERVVKRSRDGKAGDRRVFIEGVRCHWVDGDRKFQTGQFHTSELIPYEVASKGIDDTNKWISRRG